MDFNYYHHDEQTGIEIDETWQIDYSIEPGQSGNRNGHPDSWSQGYPDEVVINEIRNEAGELVNDISNETFQAIQRECLKDAAEMCDY